MSKAIRFSKAEMDAVEACNANHDNPPCGGSILTDGQIKAIGTLLAKMVAAQDDGDKPKLKVAPRAFVEALQKHLGDRLVVFDHPSTWIKLYSALKAEPFENIESVEELAASMTWVKGTIGPLVIANNGGEWLARHRAQKKVTPTTAGPKKISWD